MEGDPFLGDVRPIKGVRGVFRKRIGDYRLIFTVDFQNEEVAVLRIGQRENFYRNHFTCLVLETTGTKKNTINPQNSDDYN